MDNLTTSVPQSDPSLEAFKAAPKAVQNLILSGKFEGFAQSLRTKFNFGPALGTEVSNELMFVLLGMVPPEELFENLIDLEGIDEGDVIPVIEEFTNVILTPLRGTATPKPAAPLKPAPQFAPINRLQTTPPAPPKPMTPPVPPAPPKPVVPPTAPGKKMDIHPVEKHLELPPHEAKVPVVPPTPKPRPYVPPPAPMRTMKTDVAANKQTAMPPVAPKPVPPAPPKPMTPPVPPAADTQKSASDPYREPIE